MDRKQLLKTIIKLEETSSFLQLILHHEERVSAFLKEFSKQMAIHAKKAVEGGYNKIKEPQSKEVVKNLVVYQIKDLKSRMRKSKNPKMEFKEEYFTALIVKNVKKSFGKLHSKKNVVIKFIPNSRRKAKKLDDISRFMVKHGPWMPIFVQHIPKSESVTTLFVKVRDDELKKTYDKNMKVMEKMRTLMKAYKIKPKSKKTISKYLVGIEDLQFWILRNEFGIDAKKVPVWKDMVKYMMTKGWQRILNNNPELEKTLTDPNFRDYKKFLKDDKMIERKEFDNEFQKKILS